MVVKFKKGDRLLCINNEGNARLTKGVYYIAVADSYDSFGDQKVRVKSGRDMVNVFTYRFKCMKPSVRNLPAWW